MSPSLLCVWHWHRRLMCLQSSARRMCPLCKRRALTRINNYGVPGEFRIVQLDTMRVLYNSIGHTQNPRSRVYNTAMCAKEKRQLHRHHFPSRTDATYTAIECCTVGLLACTLFRCIHHYPLSAPETILQFAAMLPERTAICKWEVTVKWRSAAQIFQVSEGRKLGGVLVLKVKRKIPGYLAHPQKLPQLVDQQCCCLTANCERPTIVRPW